MSHINAIQRSIKKIVRPQNVILGTHTFVCVWTGAQVLDACEGWWSERRV
jgi:hypothetical protein